MDGENEVQTEAPEAEAATEKTTKSIVPAKYAGKYKGGGSDALAKFINEQAKDEKGGFSYDQFFALCRKNGLPEEKVAHYEGQVAEKRLGAPGRARMTLRNMLATIARKDGKLKDLNEMEVEVVVEKPALSGAAAATAAKTEEGAEASQF